MVEVQDSNAAQRNDAEQPDAAWGDGSPGAPHVVILAPAPRAARRQTYAIYFRGELLAVARDPEFEVCRLLLADGHTGCLETRWAGAGHAAMRLDIATGARLTTTDAAAGVRIVKWRPIDLATTDD